MLVEFGNTEPHVCTGDAGSAHGHESLGWGPVVTSMHIPDSYSCDPAADVMAVSRHLLASLSRGGGAAGITSMEGIEAILAVVHPAGGAWQHHGAGSPSWVWSDNPDLQRFLCQFWDLDPAAGRPVDVEDTHYTIHGPPGVVPGANLDLEANITHR